MLFIEQLPDVYDANLKQMLSLEATNIDVKTEFTIKKGKYLNNLVSGVV